MSNRYKGGVISATPPTLVAGAGASGAWTLEQQMQATAAGLWPVNGPFYIEDVFSTYLYTGNGSTQTITNGIDLSTYGGLVWTKWRSGTTYTTRSHQLFDSARGLPNALKTDTTGAQINTTGSLTTFNTDGFSFGGGNSGLVNWSGENYASWTFRKQPKFFDVVTWTGDGTVGRTIAHNLGSTPGCIIVKCTNNTTAWAVWHRSGTQSNRYGAFLNTTATYTDTLTQLWGATGGTPAMTSTSFSVGDAVTTNDYFNTYVAYVFAHDAGGFGLTGTDNVISCGSFTCDGSGSASVTLGYEPQWIMFKKTSATGNWWMFDNMRGLPAYNVSGDQVLYANLSSAEASGGATASANATGFAGLGLGASSTYIYIAIRRGPMKVPTSGTSVFSPVAYTGNATDTTRSAGFPVDMLAILRRSNPFGDGDGNPRFMDRLRGGNSTSLISSSTAAEETSTNNTLYLDNSVGFKTTANNAGAPTGYYFNVSTNPYIAECFRRAPSFFDEVCYTGTGANATWSHNLGAVPEMMIVKKRGGVANWAVYHSALGAAGYVLLNTTAASTTSSTFWQSTTPTATSFYTGTNGNVGDSGLTYVAYLFATCAGVSKVGSYTGTGTTLQVNCGFTSGSRFVLIKRTDSTGDWYVWDSARGIVAGNDPYLLLNSTAAEVTNTDYVDTYSAGFEISSTAPAAINASGGTFIFLAIA